MRRVFLSVPSRSIIHFKTCISYAKARFEKGGLGGSIIRHLSAPTSLTVNVESKVMPADRGYCNTDSHHFNTDSMGAKEAFRGILPISGPLLRLFGGKKVVSIIGKKLDLCGLREVIESSLLDIS